MNDFHMEIPLEQRDRLRVLERQRELAMKKRLGDDMDRDRAAFILERDRAVGLSERLLDRDRLGERMMGVNRFLDRGREREARLAAGDRPAGVDRRLESVVGGSRIDVGLGLSRFEGAAVVDRRMDGGGDRRLEAVTGRDEDREGLRPATRPSTLDRLRQTDRERDEEREKARDRVREEDGVMERSAVTEKLKERDDSAGALQELVVQYMNALVELTFNSKPIITNLTIIAGENAQAAKGIAAAVCARILEVPNEQKLPTLYLLDSIVKNIGGDYVKYFAARLPEVFCKAYKQVDPSTHPSMQHLFRTWRGVFPGAPLRKIETELEFPPIANGASLTSNAKAAESPSQRPGHSIHVNPKYLEAQRRLQQSSRAEAEPTENNGETSIREIERPESVVLDSPKGWPDTPERSTLLPRVQREDVFGAEPGYARKPPSSFLDYDYGSADPRNEIVGERVAARDEAWERGWLSGSEDAVRSLETGSGRLYSQRNGYEARQPSPRALVDAYGNIRGPRAPRMPPPPVQAVQGINARNKGPARNWNNSEEEEYVWEDMSPRVLDNTRLRETTRNNNWYSRHGDSSLMSGGSSREKPTSLDQPLPDHLGWHRVGALNDRPMSAEGRLAIQREPDERMPLSNLQQDIGPRVVPELATDISTLGNSRSGLALRPPSRLRHPLPQQLSPPAQSRMRPLQVSVSGRNPSPSSVGSVYLPSQSAKLSLLSSSNGMPEVMGPNMGVRAMMRPGMGSSFGGVMLNLGSLSPVTPGTSITFQQRQLSQRPPSPPPMAPLSQLQLPLIPPIAPVPQVNFQSLQQQNSNILRPIQNQALSSGSHGSQSSQQGLPFLSLPQQPPVQQLLQVAQPLPQPRQPLQPTLHSQSMPPSQPISEQKVPSRQPLSRPSPMPPQLLQSLQQLQHHLPPISGTSLQQSQAAQPHQHLQSAPPPVQQGQPSQLMQQTQLPPQQLLPPPPQPLQQTQTLAQQAPQLPQVSGYVPQPVGSAVNDNSSSSSGVQSQSNTNLLAAFLQSGLMPPPQGSQILTHQPSSPKASSGSTESTTSQPSTHLQPPLPCGPPPIQASNSGAGPLPGQGVLSLPSALPIMTPVPVPPLANIPAFTSQPLRMAQPPLPPGPPPVSSQVGTSLSQPPAPLANNLSSLLSSLVAQGLISATSSARPILSQSSGGMTTSSTSSVTAFPSSSVGLAFSGAPLVPPPRTSVSGVPALSSTLVTASRTNESMAAPVVTLLKERITAMDPIGMEFKQDVLRERHESVINALYFDFPRQCKTCGLRFKLQEDHSKHMDWHVSRNRRQKSSKKISRKWFVSVKEWLSGTGASASEVAPSFFAEDVAVKPEEHEVVAVPADENQSTCALCGEPFEDFYSDETEEWMYKGAVYMNVPASGVTEAADSSLLGPIVHAKCRSESGATVNAADSAEDDEGEEDDELGRRRKRVRY